jgi:hypothetical protein
LQLLWPFSREWFISGASIFLRTERRDPFSAATLAINASAAIREVLVLGPVVLALVWTRRARGQARRLAKPGKAGEAGEPGGI